MLLPGRAGGRLPAEHHPLASGTDSSDSCSASCLFRGGEDGYRPYTLWFLPLQNGTEAEGVNTPSRSVQLDESLQLFRDEALVGDLVLVQSPGRKALQGHVVEGLHGALGQQLFIQ